jgi:hypothetical protein
MDIPFSCQPLKEDKGHKSILCEDFRYRLDVETKSGDLSWICSAKGWKARVRTDAGPTPSKNAYSP